MGCLKSLLISVFRFFDAHEPGINALSTSVIAVFTVALVCVTRKLWTETRNAGIIAEEHMRQTKHLVELSRAEFATKNRPRIEIRRVQIREKQLPMGLEFVIANTGLSVAKVFATNMTVKLVRSDEVAMFLQNSIPLYEQGRTDIGTQEYGPGVRQPMFIEGPCISGQIIDSTILREARSDRGSLFFYGFLHYTNIAGENLTTGFFRRYAPGDGHRWIESIDPDYEYS